MDRSVWFSRRALKLHAVIVVIVPAFTALCVWQIDRALGGNSLSWAYVFEWPFFAGYAIYMWWRLVHETPADLPRQPAGPEVAAVEEDPELAAYNAYLAELAEQDRPTRQSRGR